jgi:hypothetical protein
MLAALTGITNPTVLDNVIDASAEVAQTTVGYHIWNDPTSTPFAVSGGSVTGADYGIWINNYDGDPSQSGQPYINANTQITISGVTINDASLAGLYVKDNPIVTTTASVKTTLQDVRMNQSAVGVQVEGTDASAVVKGSSLAAATTVFSLTNGALTAYANNLTGYTDGLNNSNGTANLKHNWWGTYSVTPTLISAEDWQARLGAQIVDFNRLRWAEGEAGTTLSHGTEYITYVIAYTATLSGGTGTAVIVAHGSTEEDAPFGNSAAGISMCSGYYDFFTVNGSGTWNVSVPVDSVPGECLTQTLDPGKIYWIPPTTDYAAECITPNNENAACWELIMTGVVTGGQNITVTGLTPTQLGGTQFVAGSDTGTDPTAVAIVAFTATTDRAAAPAGIILVSALVAVGIVLIVRRRR